MKITAAVVNKANEEYAFETVTLSEIQPDEVIVKMVASGICQSDEGIRTGKVDFPLPAVLGHEGAGIIEKVGAAVTEFAVGDQVVMAYDYCGSCGHCRTGHPSSCEQWPARNMFGVRPDGSHIFFKEDGTPITNFFYQSSFATYTVTRVNNLIKVDPDVDLRFVGPLGCGLLTGFGTVVNGLKPETGSSIAVFGTGGVGFGSLMAAKIEGCETIIAIDIHDARLEMAKELGATHTINSLTENLAEQIGEITGGKGVNYSIDTTGIPAVIKASVGVLSIGGTTAPIAITNQETPINTTLELAIANRSIKGILMGDAIPQMAVPQLIRYYNQDKFAFDKLVKFYKFDDINQATADSNSGATIKPVLIIDETYRKDEPVVYQS